MKSIEKIVSECIKGSINSQKSLYDLLSPKMFGMCMLYAKNKSDAELLLRDGMIELFLNLNQYNGFGDFKNWARMIIRNSILKKFKHIKFKPESIIVDDKVEFDNFTVSDISMSEIVHLIQDLPDDLRIVFNLHVYEEMNHERIAQKLNITELLSRQKTYIAKRLLVEQITNGRLD